MRTAVRAGRFGLLPALLLVLLGVSAVVAPDGGGYALRYQASQQRLPLLGESASAAPSVNDDLHDWLRLSLAARQAPTADVPQTWWAVLGQVVDEHGGPGRPPVGVVGGRGIAAAGWTAWSSRGPPLG
ncbi:hypothetical protein [Saccharothrix syringae]|uniref:Uncharacterized protein n=1 Tax=Saccharothrix syringae TaxID=103733 RepID=A0A5Q0GXY8_SACSY|nr:hypothetical protein [Saccharothrix syringae]QFZ18831.1 hypothetical protein EKG83_16485 [Saccharothrix syringae]